MALLFAESQKWWPQELELQMLELCEVRHLIV